MSVAATRAASTAEPTVTSPVRSLRVAVHLPRCDSESCKNQKLHYNGARRNVGALRAAEVYAFRLEAAIDVTGPISWNGLLREKSGS